MARIPSWQEFAENLARTRVDADRYRQEAIQRGDKREIVAWDREIGKWDKMLSQWGITIHHA